MLQRSTISKFRRINVWQAISLGLMIPATQSFGWPIWMPFLIIFAGITVSVLLTRVPTAEEEVQKNAEWLAQIDRDYRRVRSVEDRLDELERLKRRDLVTPEEYAAKRQEILKDL